MSFPKRNNVTRYQVFFFKYNADSSDIIDIK